MRICAVIAIMLLYTTAAQCAENAENAKFFYEKVVQTQPDNKNAQFDLGNVYLMEKRYEDALSRYEKVGKSGLAALRMGSYYFNLSVCYAGLGRMEEAVISLEACIKLNPGNQEARELLDIYKSKLSP